MKRYEFYVPPVRDWGRLWLENYLWLLDCTFGRPWRAIKSLRDGS